MNSQLGKINWLDLAKGLAMATLMAIITLVYQGITAGNDINLKKVGLAALGAALAYLIKQFGTDSQGVILGKADRR